MFLQLDVSFGHFVQQMWSDPALLITTLLTIGVIFVNGWTDAPNAIATCISTRCMGVRPAILMSAIFNFLGVFIMTHINSSVAFTISNMVDFGGNSQEALIALCAALFSIVVYSTGASFPQVRATALSPASRARPSPYTTAWAASISASGRRFSTAWCSASHWASAAAGCSASW